MEPKATLGLMKLRTVRQLHINSLFHNQGEVACAAALRSQVQGHDAKLLERVGAEMVLGACLGQVEARGTVYAKPGDIVWLDQDPAGVVSFYSVRAARSCIVGAGIKPVLGWDEAFAFWRRQAGKEPATWITYPCEDGED
jgi:hypothetical protein